MTFTSECFLLDCIVKYKNIEETNLRFPQFLFNELYEERLDIVREIIGTEYDFYYDEKLDGSKWGYVTSIWSGDEYII